MIFSFNKSFALEGIISGITLMIVPIIGVILTINGGNIYIIWGIVASINIILFFGIIYYLKKNFFQLEKENITEEERESKKRNSILNKVSKEKIILIFEIAFWCLILIISFLYVYIHGFLIVSDGYLEQAQVYYYLLFGGDEPSSFAFTIYNERKFFFRPLYPLLTTICSKFFTFLFQGINTIEFSGVFLNITSGFITLYYFGNIISLISDSKISKRMARFLIGTMPTFIVYWTKFSTDMFFLLLLIISLYYLFKYYKKPQNKKYFFIFLLTTLITCMIRELGIFLLFPGIKVLFKSKRKLGRFLQISAFLGGLMLSFIIFSDKLINSRYHFYYFYKNIYPIDPNNPSVDLSNFNEWLMMSLNNYFGINTIIDVFFASLWSFGFFFILLFLNLLRFSKKFENLSTNFNFRNATVSFFISYLLFLLIMIGSYISERYFLPLSACVVISLIVGNKKIHEKKNILIIGIGYNLVLVIVRLSIISVLI